MKNVLKKLLGLALVGTSVFTFGVTSRAQEVVTEVPAIEVVVTEEGKFAAVVTLTIEDEYNFVLDENGVIVLIEGPNEELIATLLEEGKTLNESIQMIVATYGEDAVYTVVVISDDEALTAVIEESLKEVIQQEEETEISEQPEFIKNRFAMAKELGITPGKMNLLEKLAAVAGEEIDYEEWSQKPVKEIMAQIKENRAVKDKDDSADEDTQLEAEKAVSDTKTVKAEVVESKKEQSKPGNSKGQSQNKSEGKSEGKSQGKGKNK